MEGSRRRTAALVTIAVVACGGAVAGVALLAASGSTLSKTNARQVAGATRSASGQRGRSIPARQGSTQSNRAAVSPKGGVLAIGASVMLAAEPELQQRFSARVNIERHSTTIIDRLDAYRQANALPSNVIVQIGDDGPLSVAQASRLREVLQTVRHVVLVNVRDPNASWQNEVDATLARSVTSWPQAAIADWRSAAADRALTFDGVHPNSAGAAVYVRVIGQAFAKLLARPSPPPPIAQPTTPSVTTSQTQKSASQNSGTAGAPTIPNPSPITATMIGDSVSASIDETPSAGLILRRGIKIRLDLKVCRRLIAPSCPYQGQAPPTAVQTLDSLGASLGSVLIMDVGYNDDSEAFVPGINQVMRFALTHGVQRVIWVNLRVVGGYAPTYTAINAALERASHRWPQLQVADWNGFSAGKPWFASDGLHMGAAGADALASFLRPYILGQAS